MFFLGRKAAKDSFERFEVQEVSTLSLLPVIADGKNTARFGPGALNANEYNGKVNVNRNNTDNLDNIYDNRGGRRAEVVKMKTPD